MKELEFSLPELLDFKVHVLTCYPGVGVSIPPDPWSHGHNLPPPPGLQSFFLPLSACSSETEMQHVYLLSWHMGWKSIPISKGWFDNGNPTIHGEGLHSTSHLETRYWNQITALTTLPAPCLSFPGPEGSWGRTSKEKKSEGQGFRCERWTEPERGKGEGEQLWMSLLGTLIFLIICINHLSVKAPHTKASECADDNKLGSTINSKGA